jgi:hypothetical protein
MIEEPWEIDIAHLMERGMEHEDARAFTIIRWAHHGDLRPLARALLSGPLDKAVTGFLVDMIQKDKLRVVHRRRGPPKKPEAFAKNLVAALAYEDKDAAEGSDAAIERIAATLGMSHQSVRQAITRKRRTK